MLMKPLETCVLFACWFLFLGPRMIMEISAFFGGESRRRLMNHYGGLTHKNLKLAWDFGRILLRWPTRDMKTQSLRISLASYHESTCSNHNIYCILIYIYIEVCLWSTNQSYIYIYRGPLWGTVTSQVDIHPILGVFGGLNNNRFGWVAMQLGAPPKFLQGICGQKLLPRLETSAFIFVGESDLNWVFKWCVSYSFEHWWYCSWTKLR